MPARYENLTDKIIVLFAIFCTRDHLVEAFTGNSRLILPKQHKLPSISHRDIIDLSSCYGRASRAIFIDRLMADWIINGRFFIEKLITGFSKIFFELSLAVCHLSFCRGKIL